MNRRQFIGTSAALATASGIYSATAEKPLRVGLIGCGWYGKCDLLRFIQVEPVEVISLCDVDKNQLSGAVEIVSQRQKSGKKPRTYADYREMLKEKDLDVVLIATPDHWHALPMIAAVEAGADVYVQKPISVDVMEGKAMLDAARNQNRTVQVGTQRRSTPHLIEARDRVVKEGLLGKIGMAEVYCYYHMRRNVNSPVSTPPEFIDFNAWVGPAPVRPYDPSPGPNGEPPLPHRGWWRSFVEYGNGIVGDMCIHMLDMVRWMCGLGWPHRVDSSGGILVQKESKANISDTQTATFDFPEFPVVWNHRTYGAPADPEYPWGATIYGDKGTLKLSVDKYEFFPLGQNKPKLSGKALFEYEKYPEDEDEKDLERHVASAIRGHMRDLLRAREEHKKPVADIEQGYISTTSCILANLSMKLGRSLTWDPVKHQVVNDPEANKLLKRPYRSGWDHPAG
ncbi:MAG TPA: Gfo/Idh/MocA family oxidoreductase [Gemmata sp.]|jgi:predicted dehydrogenase|nr:Gfo/Idh/MocA family oxidoreductase [Gemmata sp.]